MTPAARTIADIMRLAPVIPVIVVDELEQPSPSPKRSSQADCARWK